MAKLFPGRKILDAFKTIFRTAIIALAIVTAFGLTLFNVRYSHADDAYTLGVFPYLPPARLDQSFGFFASTFSQALGRHVSFRSRSTFANFRKEVEAETYDIIFVQPFDYIEAADKYDYLPAARINEPLTAIIVAKKDSKLEKLRDLKHKVIAMPPMTSAVSRLSRAALLEIGYDFPTDVKMLHFRTHPAGLQAVLIGKAKACGTNAVPLRVFQSKTGIMFKVLAETDKIPHVLFAVHKRVPAHDRDLIRRSIIELKNTPEGRLLLRQSGMLKGFVAAIDGDYDIVRSMSRALGGK